MPETLFVVQLVKHKTHKLQLMIILLAIAPMAARRCGLYRPFPPFLHGGRMARLIGGFHFQHGVLYKCSIVTIA